ncbi:MAG TPA: efflux RND transporter periplasmic adaptor subunit [Longimicrobiaceae bacterium]|nr:efflux RND transporter periplasmic adaptor subunit [Longimicrobiaceae bacterium]
MKSIRIAAVAALLVLATAAFFLVRGKGGEDAAAFRYGEVTRGDLSQSVSATGALGAVTTVQVGTQVSGQVSAIYADFNDHVKRGQLLARIDPTLAEQSVQDAQAGLDRARAGVQQAQADYARNRPLYDAKVITAEEFQGYEYKLRVAQADLKSAQVTMQRAQRNLGYTEIYAPIDGIVVERNVDVGQTVAASFSAPQLFLIANDLSKMQILANVDESDIGQIHTGQPVSFTVQSFADRTFHGTVKQVRLQSKTTENVVNYTAVVEVDNPGGTLLPGMTATVDFQTGAATNALLVPNAALRFTPSDDELKKAGINPDSMRAARASAQQRRAAAGGGANANPFGGGSTLRAAGGQARSTRGRIWVEEAGGKLRMVRVTTGLTDGKNTVVEGQGLREGMKIVIGSNVASTSAQGAGQTSNPLGPQQQRRGPGGF